MLIIGMFSTLQAYPQSLHENYEAAKQATNKYESLRLLSLNEGVLYECGGVTYNFLEGFVFFMILATNLKAIISRKSHMF